MMVFGQSSFEDLPQVPVTAPNPHVPAYPWTSAYRPAPGAMIPAVPIPGVSGLGNVRFMGAMGQHPANVQIVGADEGEMDGIGYVAVNALIAAALGAVTGHFASQSRRPALLGGGIVGGLGLLSGLYWWAKHKDQKNKVTVVPAP